MNKSRIFYKVLSFVFVIISMSLVYSFDSEDDSVIEPKPSPTPIEGVYKGEYFVDNTNGSDSNHSLWINEVVPSGKYFSDQNYIYNNTIFIDENYSTAIDMDGTNTHIYNNIFYAINGAAIGGS